MLFHVSGGNWCRGPLKAPIPALLTKISSLPNDAWTWRAIRSTEEASATSHVSACAVEPVRESREAVSSSFAFVLPHKTSDAPSSASRKAIAAPIPRPAPVTIATWPSKGRSVVMKNASRLHVDDSRLRLESILACQFQHLTTGRVSHCCATGLPYQGRILIIRTPEYSCHDAVCVRQENSRLLLTVSRGLIRPLGIELGLPGRMTSLFSLRFQGAIGMKNLLVALVLSAAAVAQTPAPQAQPAQPAQPAAQQPAAQQPAAQQPAAAAQQKKEIKDPAEYNAYVGAVQQQDPTAKISGLEAFLTQYPNSVMKEDALDLLMATYQQANNQAKVVETANKILAANPDNVKALVLLAYYDRAGQKWADAKQHAERGLQALPKWTKPEGVSDADFEKQKTQFSGLLSSVAGLSALQLKDYPAAQKGLRAAVEA